MNPRDAADGAIVNALTIDVEDYFQVSAFAAHIPRASWDSLPCRVERNIDRILQLLADAGVRATFFTLGWIAERYPDDDPPHRRRRPRAREPRLRALPRDRAGIRASSSPTSASPRPCSRTSSGAAVKGYRAPSFSIGPSNQWAFECIAEAGYRYSSSIYPIRHDHYGAPDAPRFAHEVDQGLLEVPITTVRVLRSQLAGGRRRLFPAAAVSRVALVAPARQRRRPAAGDVLLPSVGARSRAAARRRARAAKRAFATTSTCKRMESAAAAPARRFPVGSRRPRVPEWRRLMPARGSDRAQRRARCRTQRRRASRSTTADAARWDAFVDALP